MCSWCELYFLKAVTCIYPTQFWNKTYLYPCIQKYYKCFQLNPISKLIYFTTNGDMTMHNGSGNDNSFIFGKSLLVYIPRRQFWDKSWEMKGKITCHAVNFIPHMTEHPSSHLKHRHSSASIPNRCEKLLIQSGVKWCTPSCVKR